MVLLVTNKSKQQIVAQQEAVRSGLELVPAIIRDAGQRAVESYLCFFAGLASRHTGYVMRAATKQFFQWSAQSGLALDALRAGHVNNFFSNATWKPSTTKLYFGSLKRLFAHLEADRVIERSPFAGLSAPKPEPHETTWGTLADLKQLLLELDGYQEGSDSYRAGLVAMYPVVIGGMDLAQIAKATDIPLAEVETYAKRLRDNGIWLDNGKISLSYSEEDERKDGIVLFTVELVLIIGCAAGIFCRTSDDRLVLTDHEQQPTKEPAATEPDR